MAFFKYPYSSYEKINLDWVLRKIKALEPAIPLVEQSAAIVEEVHETAQEAAAAAESAQQAVATVTALAEQARETAEEAKDIATQAASATIADGSVGWVKLGTDVQQVITGNVDRSTAAQTNAAIAQQTATNAQTAANNAAQAAETAQQTASAAQQTANDATTALATKAGKWILAGALNRGERLTIPNTASAVMVEAQDGRGSVYMFTSTTFITDQGNNVFIVVPLYDGEMVICAFNSDRTLIFDPNLSAPTNVYCRVYYN